MRHRGVTEKGLELFVQWKNPENASAAIRQELKSFALSCCTVSSMQTTCSQAEFFSQALAMPFMITTGRRCCSSLECRGRSCKACLHACALL